MKVLYSVCKRQGTKFKQSQSIRGLGSAGRVERQSTASRCGDTQGLLLENRSDVDSGPQLGSDLGAKVIANPKRFLKVQVSCL